MIRCLPVTLATALVLMAISPVMAQGRFSADDRARIVHFWAAPDRYQVSVPERNAQSPWQVRLTPEGSEWLLKFQRVGGAGKLPPTADTLALSGAANGWKDWVQNRTAYDRWLAQITADRLNAAAQSAVALRGDRNGPSLPSRGSKRGQTDGDLKAAAQSGVAKAGTQAADPMPPGPIPIELLATVGNPPALAETVVPLQHTVTFDEGDAYVYQDHTNVRPTYAYYRYRQGVGTAGAPLTNAERSILFAAAGLNESEKRVMMAISKLEGSFDAVNTYDTGYVSVGFIQFITFDDGRHSLAEVLSREKTDAPSDFERDFRRFGIDLNAEDVLTVVDPSTGAEVSGPEAVRKVIDDKRLIAVFQKAGKSSKAFRIAQVQIAKCSYWPANEPITVTVAGQTVTGKLSDVIKTEAGMATFLDRKVNRGNILPLPDVLLQTMLRHNLTQLSEASKYEREIVAACKYRVDFLMDSTLSQPEAQASP